MTNMALSGRSIANWVFGSELEALTEQYLNFRFLLKGLDPMLGGGGGMEGTNQLSEFSVKWIIILLQGPVNFSRAIHDHYGMVHSCLIIPDYASQGDNMFL
eukprot:Gb_23516 [translate_table: standard]